MFCIRFVNRLFLKSVFLTIGLWLNSMGAVFADVTIEGIRLWAAPESTRVILDLSHPVKYKLFTLENPHRIVIDIPGSDFKATIDEISLMDTGISHIRHSRYNNNLRLVLDLESPLKPSSFLLTPNQAYGHRLVVDLSKNSSNFKLSSLQLKASTRKSYPKSTHRYEMRAMKETKDSRELKDNDTVVDLSTREFIVAIDPGHGGDDTGAIGRNHQVKEKNVVLAVSKKLEQLINAQPGTRAFLVRSGDYYIDLRKRMVLAREQGADLFISVHADSFKDTRASGASVFVLSEKGASNEAARWLAERENRSDLIGGVKLEDKGELLASVLLDLSQTASQSASHELANHLIKNLGKITDLHHKTVQSAGFMVLKSPDIPSVLVELGFISNKHGEEKLLNPTHQQALASALLTGVKAYINKRPLPVKHPQDWKIAKK